MAWEMKSSLHITFSLPLILSILLGACGSSSVDEGFIPTETPGIEISNPAEISTVTTDFPPLLVNFWKSIPANSNFGLVSAANLSRELAVDNSIFLLDVREPAELKNDGYLEGAVNIPLRTLLKNLDKLPDPEDRIVIYCGSEHRGGFALMALKMLGYVNVRNMGDCRAVQEEAKLPIMTGGMPEAPKVISAPTIVDEGLFNALDDFLSNLPEDYLAIEPKALASELINGSIFLLDVRMAAEREANGFINGSVSIPFPEFLRKLDQLPAEKDVRIVVYGASGHRSSIVTMTLRLLGYSNAFNLSGGLNKWRAEGNEVTGLEDWEAVLSQFITDLPSEQGYYSITAVNLEAARAEAPVYLLDVRKPDEVASTGHIKGAVNIPIPDLLDNLDKLPARDQRIVVYCEPCYSGAMGAIALRSLGYTNVLNLDGGIGSWIKAGYSLEPGLPAPARILTPEPEVDQTRLTLLDNYLTAMSEDVSTLTTDELQAMIESGEAPLILDVRDESNIPVGGAFEGAISMPVHEIPENLKILPADPSSPIVIICGSGHCGAIAKMYLNFLGYIDVKILPDD